MATTVYPNLVFPEAVFLVVCDPSIKELWATNSVCVNELLNMKIMEFLVTSHPQKLEL